MCMIDHQMQQRERSDEASAMNIRFLPVSSSMTKAVAGHNLDLSSNSARGQI